MTMSFRWALLTVTMFSATTSTAGTASFDSFNYSGNDPEFSAPLAAGSYQNPILAGFYPDPSVTSDGEYYYLTTSTFGYFPGLPVFRSKDLTHWTLISHGVTAKQNINIPGRPATIGLFAPAIEYHDGTFYLLSTVIGGQGNFVVTSNNPEEGWSEPHWLPEIQGIDPSLFFDDDGKAYIVNTGYPEGEQAYPEHKTLWLQPFDPVSLTITGPRKPLVDKGTPQVVNPHHIEGPHLYKVAGKYYLSAAQGGTESAHSQVIFRSDNLYGPYESYSNNPVLTQRDLPEDRPLPVANTGHADFIQDHQGNWQAVFLGVRPYKDNHFNTGRETFLLPMEWNNGWPVILEKNDAVPFVVSSQTTTNTTPLLPTTGNFSLSEQFDDNSLHLDWLSLRTANRPWLSLRKNRATITATPGKLSEKGLPAYLGIRQQHKHAAFSASMAEISLEEGEFAGVALFQNESHFYQFGVRAIGDNGYTIEISQGDGNDEQATTKQVFSAALPVPVTGLELAVSVSPQTITFSYTDSDNVAHTLPWHGETSYLSTASAGGFTGVTLGLVATTGD